MSKKPWKICLVLSAMIVVSFAVFLFGFGSITHREYKEFLRDIDGKSELKISTYPSGFPTEVSNTLISRKMPSSDKVYFQVLVRDKKQKSGPNPNVESILFHSFSYALDDGLKTELISDYARNFWMQGNSNYDKLNHPPIPYRPDSVVSIEIDLTLNGKDYSFKGQMPAKERTTYVPRFLFDMGV